MDYIIVHFKYYYEKIVLYPYAIKFFKGLKKF